MTEQIKSWWRIEYLSPLVVVLFAVMQLGLWLNTNAVKNDAVPIALTTLSDQTKLSVITMNSRLDRIFEKLEVLAADQIRITALENRIPNRDHQIDVLATELHAIQGKLEYGLGKTEANTTAIAEITSASRPRLRP